MALSTYGELKAAIADYLGRGDLTARIPDFIALAEERFSREMRLRPMVKRVTLALAPSASSVALPADYLETISLVLSAGSRRKLSQADVDTLEASDDPVGEPVYFAVVGNSVKVSPATDSARELVLTYYGTVTPLSDAAPVNFLLTASPSLYLYGSLLESIGFTRNEAAAATWNAGYSAAKTALVDADARGRRTHQASMRPIRRA